MKAPRFSIVTATLNRAALLREAIASVEGQGREDVEHLIIDGGSSDGTREMLAAHPRLRVVSEPDRGLYDAFNKGLALASGDIVHFLNSDDLLVPGALAAVDAAFADERVDVVTGAVDFFERAPDGNERVLRRVESGLVLELSLRRMLRGVSVFNARFFRRSFALRVGPFDLAYRIAADRDFLVRAALARPRSIVVPQMVYRYRSHAGSLTVHESDRNAALIRSEHVALAEKHLAHPLARADRAELTALHRRESAALAVEALAAGRWSEMRAWARRGCAASALWPCAAAVRLGGWLLGRSSHGPLAPAETSAP